MFCPKCGNPVDPTMAFCGQCGNRLNAEPTPAPAPTGQPNLVYFSTEDLTLVNYHLVARDAAGNVRCEARTVSESMFTYNAKIFAPNGQELMAVRQQKKMTMVAMNFDLCVNGQPVCEVLQEMKGAGYRYVLPQYGLYADGDFFSLNFQVFANNGAPVASVQKKLMSWGDSYEISFADPSLELTLLGLVMVIQMVLAAQRNHRRRR
ncbi:MAG: zinc-ribbon domain-containing protein [Clostridia bacterium]|nr:zinc-ribbon domain-containing protein [Clostridia bacterium]